MSFVNSFCILSSNIIYLQQCPQPSKINISSSRHDLDHATPEFFIRPFRKSELFIEFLTPFAAHQPNICVFFSNLVNVGEEFIHDQVSHTLPLMLGTDDNILDMQIDGVVSKDPAHSGDRSILCHGNNSIQRVCQSAFC